MVVKGGHAMPKFSENERAFIQKKLLVDGEQLFIRHGLKKVTVDDLVKTVGIAKGSFYAFYESKEHLYTDILFSLQNKVLANTKAFLIKNKSLSPKELIKKMVTWSYTEIENYPLLQPDMEMRLHLNRKLPKEILDSYSDLDLQVAKMLSEHGVKFKCEIELVGSVFQALSVVYDSFEHENEVNNRAVMNILVNSIVNEIIE